MHILEGRSPIFHTCFKLFALLTWQHVYILSIKVSDIQMTCCEAPTATDVILFVSYTTHLMDR